MNSLIGLLNSESAVYSAVENLKKAGIAEEKISLLSNPRIIGRLLGYDPARTIKNYGALGAAMGSGIYAIFGMAAAMCQCNLMQFGQEYGIGTFLGAILAGAFVGGFIGVLVGAGEAEKSIQLYVQGVRLGAKVISVQIAEEDAERVKHLLAMENVTGLKLLRLEGA